jgi:1-acyl-sn-glycerol-3-phosphate acyltransferase
LARDTLFKIPFLGRFVSAYSLPLRRESPRPSAVKEAVRRLRRGELMVIFPEGSRYSNDKVNVKRGVDFMARMSAAAVVPALIEGSERALPAGSCFIRPAKINVRFGEPRRADGSMDIGGSVMDTINSMRATRG